jgi:hypothetical protein
LSWFVIVVLCVLFSAFLVFLSSFSLLLACFVLVHSLSSLRLFLFWSFLVLGVERKFITLSPLFPSLSSNPSRVRVRVRVGVLHYVVTLAVSVPLFFLPLVPSLQLNTPAPPVWVLPWVKVYGLVVFQKVDVICDRILFRVRVMFRARVRV